MNRKSPEVKPEAARKMSRSRGNNPKAVLNISVPVIILEDISGYVAYTPVLDYSTCGDTKEDAQKMFEEGIMVFLKELVRMGTLEEVLAEHAWKKIPRRFGPARWTPPQVTFPKKRVTISIPA
jgi:predicted RNase H-like HicB family nuclease